MVYISSLALSVKNYTITMLPFVHSNVALGRDHYPASVNSMYHEAAYRLVQDVIDNLLPLNEGLPVINTACPL
jgi:hypothetical protein